MLTILRFLYYAFKYFILTCLATGFLYHSYHKGCIGEQVKEIKEISPFEGDKNGKDD
jgi:hypothetical protein